MKLEVVGYVSHEEAENIKREISVEDSDKTFFTGTRKLEKEKTETTPSKVTILFAVDEDLIVISKAEYESLQEDSLWLGDLEAAGIDNTMAYEEACSIRRERLGEDDE